VNRFDSIRGFEFHGEDVFRQNVHPVAAIEVYALVADRKGFLPLKGDLFQVQFVAEAGFIRRFQ